MFHSFAPSTVAVGAFIWISNALVLFVCWLNYLSLKISKIREQCAQNEITFYSFSFVACYHSMLVFFSLSMELLYCFVNMLTKRSATHFPMATLLMKLLQSYWFSCEQFFFKNNTFSNIFGSHQFIVGKYFCNHPQIVLISWQKVLMSSTAAVHRNSTATWCIGTIVSIIGAGFFQWFYGEFAPF